MSWKTQKKRNSSIRTSMFLVGTLQTKTKEKRQKLKKKKEHQKPESKKAVYNSILSKKS